MESAFVVSAVTYRHLTGAVTVTAEPDGEGYPVHTATGVEWEAEVRGVWLVVELDTSAPAGLAGVAGGSGRPLRRIALDLVAAATTGAAVSYLPNADVPGTSIPVVLDVGHAPTLYAAQRGHLVPGAVLRMRSRLRYAPTDALVVALVSASPYT